MKIALRKTDQAEEGPIVAFDITALLMDQTEAAAEAICKDNGLRFRVYERQGCQAMVTSDYIITRMNVSIVDGFVTNVLGRG